VDKQELLNEFVKQIEDESFITKKKSMSWLKSLIQYNLIARLTMLASVLMSWRCAEWFMYLENPTTQQSAFVSVIMGVMTGVFVIWMGQESKK